MADSGSDDRDLAAPEGAHCAEHPDRPAHFTCPRCGSYACVVCFHPSVRRCAQCLRRDPTEAALPIAWEQRDQPLPVRYLRTLAGALSPMKTAPAFAQQDSRSALAFLLSSALPFAMLAGIVPHTRTLSFDGSFVVRILGRPSELEIALDVLRAMGVQLVLSGLQLGCLLVPFLSLVRAYAAPERRIAAFRVLGYRFWLSPGALLLLYVGAAVLPTPDPELAQAPSLGWIVVLGIRLLAEVLLILAMSATARLACGLGPFLSTVVVGIPLIFSLVVGSLASFGLEQLLPAATRPPS